MGDDTTAYTSVIDGKRIHLTPLGKQLMPPPMSEKWLQLEDFPVHFSMYGSKALVIDSSNNIYQFDSQSVIQGELKSESRLQHNVTSI